MNEDIDKKMGIAAGEFDLGLKSINIYDYFTNGE